MFAWKENTSKRKESFEGRSWNSYAYAKFQYVFKLVPALKLYKHLCKIGTLEDKLFYLCFSCISIINASSIVPDNIYHMVQVFDTKIRQRIKERGLVFSKVYSWKSVTYRRWAGI